MTRIQSKIIRHKLPKGMSYPLRFSDVEQCVGAFRGETIHLYAFFWRRASSDKDERDRALSSHRHRLVNLEFETHPPFDGHIHSICRSSESDIIDIGVVTSVFAAPRTDLRNAGFRREHLLGFLREQTEYLASDQDESSRCSLEIYLDVEGRTLECVREYSRHGTKESVVTEHRSL